MVRWSALSLWIAVAACSSDSSGSGIAETKTLGTLSTGEVDQLCSYRVEVEGGPRVVTCGDASVTLPSKATCIAELSQLNVQCIATVSDAESCYQAENKDPCTAGGGACLAYFSCLSVGQ